ncbi:MAG: cobalamin biosynthesis protein [Rhizobiales bacterium]|nr:cobalamin biosynthesis protein [Hyphomicrobiales bacterium]
MIALAHLWMLAGAILLDAAVGDPDAVWGRAPHPVVVMGRVIDGFDRFLNRQHFGAGARRFFGVVTMLVIGGAAFAFGYALEWAFGLVPFGWIGTVMAAAVLLAGRSLHDHVRAVWRAFGNGGLEAARKTVSRIVGRDPASLDEAAVSRAAIESAAENFADGVVGPAFWFALLGLPGIFAFKAINTADSMIGHLTPRHQDFGWAAARLDDLVNWPTARLSGLLVALAAPLARGRVGAAVRTMLADAPRHRSPNAGWPEAAMASALGLMLNGPRRYRGVLVDDPFLNAGGRRRAVPDDIRRALIVYRGAWAILFMLVALLAAPVIILDIQQW